MYQEGVAVAFGAEARLKTEEDEAQVLEMAEGFKLLSFSLPGQIHTTLIIVLDFTPSVCARRCFSANLHFPPV